MSSLLDDSAAHAALDPTAPEKPRALERAAEIDGSPDSLPAGSIWRKLIVLALPMLGEQLLSFMVGFVDTWLAGWISKEATAAVGAASYMNWTVMLAFSLVGIGASAVVSRARGARDAETTNRALHQSLILAAGLGVVVCAATYFAAPAFAGFLTQTQAAYAPTAEFTRIIAFAYLLGSINLVGSAQLRAAGDTRTPLAIMSIVNIINVLASWSLVFGWFGPSLGVAGIAIGTLIARSSGGVLMLLVLARGRDGLRLRRAEMRPDGEMMRRILRVGLPAGVDMGLMAVAQLLFVRVITQSGEGDAGTSNFAAHIIAVEIEGISYMPAFAWGTAAATLVGQYLGARMPEHAARAGRVAILQGVVLGVVNGLIFAVFAEYIFAIMTTDAAVTSVGVPAFRFLGAAQPFLCTAIIAITALRGAGDTRATMFMSLVGGLLLRVPIAFLGAVVFHGGLVGAWSGMWSDNVAKCVMSVGRFLHGGWRRVRV